MRKPRAKYKVGDFVSVRNWTMRQFEHGTIMRVLSQSVTTSTRQTFTIYRYMVQMDNKRDHFGASVRFLFEHELQGIATMPTNLAKAG